MSQFEDIVQNAGESVIWRQYASAVTASTSAYFAGGGVTAYYRESTITGLMHAPRTPYDLAQFPGGEMVDGDTFISTVQPLGKQDIIVWRGANYRVWSNAIPTHLGGRLWWRSIIRYGDVTG
jgi:hypothetical protein